MSDDKTTAARTADAILALINSKPYTPTKTEIEAVLATVCRPSTAVLDLTEVQAWRRLEAQNTAAWDEELAKTGENEDVSDEIADALLEQMSAEANAIWQRPVQNWGDVALRAVVAQHWICPHFNRGAVRAFEAELRGPCTKFFDERGNNELLLAVLAMSGLLP